MRNLAIGFLLALILGACQNNGDIGRMFGTWRIDSYLVDGEETDSVTADGHKIPVSNVTFSFQNDIVNAVTVLDNYQSAYSQFGTWADEGNVFKFDFTHSDDATEAGTGHYAAPTWLGMTSDEIMTMDVSDSSSREFTLTWVAPDGKTRVYKLHKTW